MVNISRVSEIFHSDASPDRLVLKMVLTLQVLHLLNPPSAFSLSEDGKLIAFLNPDPCFREGMLDRESINNRCLLDSRLRGNIHAASRTT